MAVLLRINHRDEQPMPWSGKQELDLAELVATRDYVLRHPFFPVLLRGRQLDGRSRNNYYTPRGDIQLCRVDHPWPRRWIEDVELAGEIHELGFDADPNVPRGPDAYDVFRLRLKKAMARLGIAEE